MGMADVQPFPFATVDDLRARWPDMPAGSDDHAETLLEDASQFILDVCPTAADASEGTRRRIVCSVVRRSIEASTSPMAGLESWSETTGPFSGTLKPVNPNGDFYLTKQERKALGEGRQKAFGGPVVDTRASSNHVPWCALAFGARYCSCGADLTNGEYPLYEEG